MANQDLQIQNEKQDALLNQIETEELTCYELARMEVRTGALQTISIYKAKNFWEQAMQGKKITLEILTTSTLSKLIVKVGTTSKSDVTQKEKKP